MSAERQCFSRRELRLSLGSRTSRRQNVKQTGVGGVRQKQKPSGRLGEKINEIRQTCDCEMHQKMRRGR